MTPPSDGDWVNRLERALAQVSEIEGRYLDEIADWRRQPERSERDPPHASQISDPAGDLRSFYHRARYGKGRYFEKRYGPLRAALHDAELVLGRHKALLAVVKVGTRGEEFWLDTVAQGGLRTRLDLVSGLMGRARQVGKDGFRVASRELKILLDLSLEEGFPPVPNKLTVGYHVSLFYGIQLSKGVEIADDMTAVPLEQTSAFLNRGVLKDVAPRIAEQHKWNAVGAILKPFRWKPILVSQGDEPKRQLDWGGSFKEDARAFIEILSVCHGVPVVTLMNIPYCIDRTASLLLSRLHQHASRSYKAWVWSVSGLTKSHQLDIDALNQAKQIFGADRLRYQQFAPIVSRLSEALARTGQYAADDKILDAAIALERMYELDQGEISFKLKTRAACFLESDTKARLHVFKDVEEFYGARSGIVHKRESKKQPSTQSRRDAFNKGFDVARRSLVKLLQEGSPQNWNEVVLTGTKSK